MTTDEFAAMCERRISWRDRLNDDTSAVAEDARSAYSMQAAAMPSYYADHEDHYSYELAREQAAAALWRWRWHGCKA